MYSYQKTVYVTMRTPVIITCPIHGDFKQTPRCHMNGCGCPKCVGRGRDTQQFIKEAREVHGEKYGYEKAIFTRTKDNVTITCPTHGDFEKKVEYHLKGGGCPKCAGKIGTTDQFIIQSKKIHADKYSYEKTVYTTYHEKVTITCSIHGDFQQSPGKHLFGSGCKKCACNSMNTEKFIEKAKKFTNNFFRYNKTVFRDMVTNVIITCPIHGDFEQYPYNHLKNNKKTKCAKCRQDQIGKKFLEKVEKVHNNLYTYDKTLYADSKSPIIITCHIHGDFENIPDRHIKGVGCPKCSCRTKCTEKFIENSNKVHNNFYTYEKTLYLRCDEKVIITCPIHGNFMKEPSSHLRGYGCSKCSGKNMKTIN